MVNNFYTMMGYYNETKAYELAIAMCDKVLELIPGEPQTMKIKESFTKNWEIIKKCSLVVTKKQPRIQRKSKRITPSFRSAPLLKNN